MSFMLNRVTIATATLAVLLASCTGCAPGNPRVPVTGKITVDGMPAEGAVLFFHPEDGNMEWLASATADANGSFSLVSNMEPGAKPGKYKVAVTWPDPKVKPTESQKMMGMVEPGPDLLKGKFGNKESSGLTAEIASDTKELPPIALSKK